MPKFKIQHTTKYSYETPARDSANQLMLYPVADEFQEVLIHSVRVTGDPIIEKHFDYYNNQVGTFTHSKSHNELVIDSRMEVVTFKKDLPTDQHPASAQWAEIEKVKFQVPYIDFLKSNHSTSLNEIQNVMNGMHDAEQTPFQSAKNFCEYIYKEFTYQKGITTVETTIDEIWKIKTGVCQDFAHMLLTMLRLINVPARYVSGYICPNKNGMRGEGATHAWVEAYIPFYGWLGLDPTNDCVVNENHVRLAVGRNYYDCSPVRGTYRGSSNHTMDVAVIVSYGDADVVGQFQTVPVPPIASSVSTNSYRRHQEIQQQQ
jgi:transglutaminase-like putative cysteine protease